MPDEGDLFLSRRLCTARLPCRRESGGARPKDWGIWGPWVLGWGIKAEGQVLNGRCQAGSWDPECVWRVLGGKGSGCSTALALSQGLLLWLLLSAGGVWASRGPLRPLCQPINATLAAENEACPVCITFTTSICAGYCPSMVSCPGRVETSPAALVLGWTTQGQAHPRHKAAGVNGWPPLARTGVTAGPVGGRTQRVPWTPGSGICWGVSRGGHNPRQTPMLHPRPCSPGAGAASCPATSAPASVHLP